MLLIGGPPGAGKTTLARSVGAALGFLSTTVDDLVSTARLFTDAGSHPDLHRAGGVDSVEYFTQGPPERLVNDAVALQDVMWPVLQRIIRRHVTEKAPIVMDWWLFDPDTLANSLDGSVRSVWLHVDPVELDRRERKLTEFREGSDDPERMHSNFMHRSLWRNRIVAERARAHGLPVLHQPGDKSVGDLTDETLHRLGGAKEHHADGDSPMPA